MRPQPHAYPGGPNPTLASAFTPPHTSPYASPGGPSSPTLASAFTPPHLVTQKGSRDVRKGLAARVQLPHGDAECIAAHMHGGVRVGFRVLLGEGGRGAHRVWGRCQVPVSGAVTISIPPSVQDALGTRQSPWLHASPPHPPPPPPPARVITLEPQAAPLAIPPPMPPYTHILTHLRLCPVGFGATSRGPCGCLCPTGGCVKQGSCGCL